jgi:hypothetical protein
MLSQTFHILRTQNLCNFQPSARKYGSDILSNITIRLFMKHALQHQDNFNLEMEPLISCTMLETRILEFLV